MRAAVLAATIAAGLSACGGDAELLTGPHSPASCPGIDVGARPAAFSLPVKNPVSIPVLGAGVESLRYTAEVAARGTVAYTTTWSFRGANPGNRINVWDVTGNAPVLVDTITVANATTLGDVAVSDDGSLLVVATERTGGSIVIFDLADPKHPKQLSRFSNADTDPGVHTAEIGRVNGVLYGFLSIDPINSTPARLVIVDLSNPSAPQEIFTKVTGNPFVHDTFVRDGLLFVALWDDGLEVWDIGGCGTGASPSHPVVLGGVKTLGGEVHNAWWYHDANGGKRFVFVGQEGPGTIGSSSKGDIHVVDVSDPSQPQVGLLSQIAIWLGFHNPPNWILTQPLNNFLLMVIMIWVQTGFAMVVLSAALKAVPDDVIEAARMDGAHGGRLLFFVTIPMIRNTLIVVLTTVMITTLKVFDIVRTMTGGNFGTQVLANEMYTQKFVFFDNGRGSALAVILFLAVLPLMIYNVRQLRKEREVR